MSTPDSQLMSDVQRGCLESFEELVRRYREPLVRVAASKLGDRAWAEDVVQETFLAVYAARRTYNAQFSFRTWLWTILLNLCRRQLKRRGRAGSQVLSVGVMWDRTVANLEPATTETGLTTLLRIERQERVAALLDQLPEADADALRLRFYGELKFEEIAEAMNSSVSGAKQRVRRGLQALAERLREESGETQ